LKESEFVSYNTTCIRTGDDALAFARWPMRFIGTGRRRLSWCRCCTWRSSTSSTCSRSDVAPVSSPPCIHDRNTLTGSLPTPGGPSDTRYNSRQPHSIYTN